MTQKNGFLYLFPLFFVAKVSNSTIFEVGEFKRYNLSSGDWSSTTVENMKMEIVLKRFRFTSCSFLLLKLCFASMCWIRVSICAVIYFNYSSILFPFSWIWFGKSWLSCWMCFFYWQWISITSIDKLIELMYIFLFVEKIPSRRPYKTHSVNVECH